MGQIAAAWEGGGECCTEYAVGQIAAAWEGGGECCNEYSQEHSQNDLAKPQRPAAIATL